VDDACVVRVQGEADLATCPDLELALADAERRPAERVFLDLEELTFIDVSALRVLLRASSRSASNGDRLRMTRGRGAVPRLFRLTDVEGVLPLVDAGECPAIPSPSRQPAGPEETPAMPSG
jgi:anti-anti-sigma factor